MKKLIRCLIILLILALTTYSCSCKTKCNKGTKTDSTNLVDPAPDTSIFTEVGVMPKFPEGDDALIKYMIGSIKYPAEAKKNGITGVVYISFIVEADGTITNAKVLEGVGGGCNEEALRVIKEMPKWIPGKNKGNPVRVQFTMPIKFKLS